MQELTKDEIIGFFIVSGGGILISYFLFRLKHLFWTPLILWGVSSTSWFIYNMAQKDALWFTNFEAVGIVIGVVGSMLLGCFIALQTFMMFELSSKVSGGDRNILLFPLLAILIGMVFCLISAGFLHISKWWSLLLIIGFIIILIRGDFDAADVFDAFPYFLLGGCGLMYAYTLTNLMANIWTPIVALILLYFLFKSSLTVKLISGKYPDSVKKNEISKTNRNQQEKIIETSNSKVDLVRNNQDTTGLVVIKGEYFDNGFIKFEDAIKCPLKEAKKYAQQLRISEYAEEWIKAKYPMAEVDKGWSLNVTLKEVRKNTDESN